MTLSGLFLQAGGIINVACAVGSLIPMPGDLMNFGVAKAGLMELTKGHAIQYAPDVRVNAICPGLFEGDEVSLVERLLFSRGFNTGISSPQTLRIVYGAQVRIPIIGERRRSREKRPSDEDFVSMCMHLIQLPNLLEGLRSVQALVIIRVALHTTLQE